MCPTTFFKIAVICLISLTSTFALGPAPVILGGAGNFAILAKSGVSTVPNSKITGNIGLSPAAETFLTGFSFTRSASGTFASSAQVVGRLEAADFKSPTPSILTTSVNSMITAFNDAAGRKNPTATNLAAGAIGGLTFTPGLYKWTSNVSIGKAITISGRSTDTWIFQVSGTLSLANGIPILLVGGALPKNIVFVVTGAVTLGTTSTFNGVILGATSISLKTGATVKGRLLAQTAVTLIKSVVTAPA